MWATLQIIIGSTHEGLTFEVVDLLDFPLPFFDSAAPAKTGRDYDNPTTVALGRKRMSFVGWGNVGGARAIEQLRLVAVELARLAPRADAV